MSPVIAYQDSVFAHSNGCCSSGLVAFLNFRWVVQGGSDKRRMTFMAILRLL